MASETDVAAVSAVVHAFVEALDRQDLQAALALCTDDLVFIGSGEGEQAVGRDAVIGMASDLAPKAADSRLTVTEGPLHVDVHGDVALVAQFGTATLRSSRAQRVGPYRLTGVLLRGADGWKWRVHHGSEPLPW